jgi:hypothetical protein
MTIGVEGGRSLKCQYEPAVPVIIRMAGENAVTLSHDSFSGEVLVFGQILEILCLTPESMAASWTNSTPSLTLRPKCGQEKMFER